MLAVGCDGESGQLASMRGAARDAGPKLHRLADTLHSGTVMTGEESVDMNSIEWCRKQFDFNFYSKPQFPSHCLAAPGKENSNHLICPS